MSVKGERPDVRSCKPGRRAAGLRGSTGLLTSPPLDVGRLDAPTVKQYVSAVSAPVSGTLSQLSSDRHESGASRTLTAPLSLSPWPLTSFSTEGLSSAPPPPTAHRRTGHEGRPFPLQTVDLSARRMAISYFKKELVNLMVFAAPSSRTWPARLTLMS